MFDDGQILQQPVLDLAHAVVILIEHFGGAREVDPATGLYAPGQIEHRFNIVFQHRALRSVDGCARQARKFLFRALAGLALHFGIAQAGAQRAQLLILVFAKFFLDGVDLLAQVIVMVGFVHDLAHARMDFFFQRRDFQIPRQSRQERFEPQVDRHALEHGLLVLDIAQEIRRHHVAEGLRALFAADLGAQFAGKVLSARARQLESLTANGAQHGLTAYSRFAVRVCIVFRFKHHERGALHIAAFLHIQQDGPAFAFDEHAHAVVRQAQHVADIHDRAYGVHILQVRRVHASVALRDHEQPPVALQSAFQRRYGARAAHVQRRHRIGESEHPAQGQKRQLRRNRLFVTGLTHTARPLRLILFIIQTYR